MPTPSPKHPNTIAIIQARMASSRLPGKVLREIGGRSTLGWVVERARRATTLDSVVVATTTHAEDDAVVEYCAAQDYPLARGSHHDVLDRYVQTARAHKAEIVVRITADCPLIDPGLIDKTTDLVTGNHHFAANRLPPPWGRTLPIGLDVEVCTMETLERAWREANETHHREHVMPYFYEDVDPSSLQPAREKTNPGTWYVKQGASPKGFRVALLHHAPDYGHHRWTVDTPEDLTLVREIVRHFDDDRFTWRDVVHALEREPELVEINARVAHKDHRSIDERDEMIEKEKRDQGGELRFTDRHPTSQGDH